MRYQHSSGTFRDDYPHSFGLAELAGLAAFLDSAAGVVPLREVEGADRAAVALRHDVDHNLEHALKFARWEATHGYRATYFILVGAWYAQDRTALAASLAELAGLGHEIGLHNESVSRTYLPGDAVDGSALPAGHCARAAKLLRSELELLRGMGHEIVGTAAHGSPLFYSDGIHNNDLWAAGYAPGDFGLQYEAYHLHARAHYISDNRGALTSPLLIRAGKMTHLLLHPCHWDLDALAAAA